MPRDDKTRGKGKGRRSSHHEGGDTTGPRGTSTLTRKWQDSSVAQTINLKTKDFDFGSPGISKKIYKAYVSYKGNGTGVTIAYATNGDTDTTAPFYRITADGSSDSDNITDTTPLLDVGTDDWVPAELKPVSSINNVRSFQLQFSGTAAADFEINDISVVFRSKAIK